MKHLAAAISIFFAGLPAYADGLLAEVHTDKAFYHPHTAVKVSVTLTGRAPKALVGTIVLLPQHLEMALHGPPPQPFHLAAGARRTFVFTWQPPAQDFQGYRIEAQVRDRRGQRLDSAATAADVSSTWTRFPRYGFLSGYPQQSRAVTRREIETLKNYHLNALQFYDWQWQHQQPLAGTLLHPAAQWKDIANRPVSRQTVLDGLRAAHEFHIAAMNYNLLYGAGRGGAAVDPHWGLFNDSQAAHPDSIPLPSGWAAPAIDLYNPADHGWRGYLLAREAEAFAAYPFDGWQVDQLGERGLKYDFRGQPVTVWQTFRPFLNQAKTRLRKAIIFNNVGGYGLYDTASQSTEDAVYVECWPGSGQKTYGDLKTVIDQASAWSGGKAVILAAYLNYQAAQDASHKPSKPFNPPGVLLVDAAIFAGGGAHIELGDNTSLLDSEYFPNRNLLAGSILLKALAGYYDFLTAYENLLRGGFVASPSAAVLPKLTVSSDGAPNTVWAFAKTGRGYHVLHLINLLGEHSSDWRDEKADYPAPTAQSNLVVQCHTGSELVTQLTWASPDTDSGASHLLAFTVGRDARGKYVQFTLPRLAYWDMVYWKTSLKPITNNRTQFTILPSEKPGMYGPIPLAPHP